MNALLTDTIAALATPPGRSSVAMFRVSGPTAFTICDSILRSRKLTAGYATRTLHRALIIDSGNNDDTVDDVLVAVYQAPHSYTGEDVVEITCHGGPVPIRRTLQLLLAHGARLAEPGEFTLRAYLNGKLDLAQAEAVADMIDAQTDEAHRLAHTQQSGLLSAEVGALREKTLGVLARIEATIDFPEDVGEFPTLWCEQELNAIICTLERLIASSGRGLLIREGVRVALIGTPNAGKSSLLNALLRHDRAIVTAVPGTTRDVIEESIVVKGVLVRLSDTAGIRESSDEVEKLGIDRSRSAAAAADLIVWVRDASKSDRTDAESEFESFALGKPVLLVWNKADLIDEQQRQALQRSRHIVVSALRGTGIDALEAEIARLAFAADGGETSGFGMEQGGTQSGTAVVTHARHVAALRSALQSAQRGLAAVTRGLPIDFISIEMRTTLDDFGLITGETAPQDVLGEIFSKFCIGK